ncbi:Transcription factor GRAS [Dillenia turbinata]|uniref:Transcription factor GRAS n=1 Tax=Dillenia turbinata TaxID=194707 RepID=A0AAN8ZEG7_9MAGN
MMKRGFEVVHGALDLIQPHEQWDYGGFASASSSAFGKTLIPESRSCTNLERNELSEWVEHVTKQLIEDLPEMGANENIQSDNSMMVGEENFVPSFRPRKVARGSSFDGGREENQWSNVEVGNQASLSKLDEQELSLIKLLLECAVAISVDNLGEAHRMLLELTQMASPYGPSCGERVVAYFAKAMASRVINSWLGICSPLINRKSVHCSFQVFNNACNGLPFFTSSQLSNFAKRLRMSFEFHPIAKKFGEIDVSMVQVRHGETIAVHWLQHSLYDATGPDWKTMRLLEELSPRVITLVEQEILHGGSFLDRFVGSLLYYSTIFDSLGALLSCDDPSRHRVEHCLLYREINNILAIGGPARSGEDKFRHWRSELARNCFLQVPMSANSMAQAQLILNMFPPAHGYSLVQGDGTLRLGWKNTSLYTASCWTSHASR